MRRGVFLVLVLQASVSCRLPPPAAPGRAGMEVGGADVPYNRALTASEIRAIYEADSAGKALPTSQE